MTSRNDVVAAAGRLEAALDPDKNGGWSRLMFDGEYGDEITDLRTVVAGVRDQREPLEKLRELHDAMPGSEYRMALGMLLAALGEAH